MPNGGQAQASPQRDTHDAADAPALFSGGVEHITSELACKKKDGQVTYFNGHMPVFQAVSDVPNGGVLFALPALLAIGLLHQAHKYFYHQTSVLSTDYRSDPGPVAAAMFARWSQENFFKYMREHRDWTGLLTMDSDSLVVNPAPEIADSA
jgi:hypothetical protein